MFLWPVLLFVGTSICQPVVREPCKVQCDLNFSRNSIDEIPILIPFCHRGCDLFKVALISTNFYDSSNSRQESGQNQQSHQPIVITLHKTDSSPESDISNRIIQIPEPKEPSKTTSQPTLQPVQDDPVDTGKQSSTTKVPNSRIGFSNSVTKSGQYDIDVNEGESKKEVNSKNDETIDQNNDNKTKKKRFEQAKHSCRHACVNAYGGAAEQEACVVGCHLQSTTHDDDSNDSQSRDESPLKSIQKSIFNFAGHIGRLVRFSWSWTAPKQDETSKVQVYGTQDIGRHSPFPFYVNIKSSSSFLDNLENMKPRKISEAGKADLNAFKEFMDSEFAMKPYPMEMNEREDMNIFKVIDKLKERKETHHHKESHITEIKSGIHRTEIKSSLPTDLLACISRKTGLPRWFVATIFFSSIPFAIWLVISLASGSDETKSSKKSKVIELEVDCNCNDSGPMAEKHLWKLKKGKDMKKKEIRKKIIDEKLRLKIQYTLDPNEKEKDIKELEKLLNGDDIV